MTIEQIRELLQTCETQAIAARTKAMFSDTSLSIEHLAKINLVLSQACLQLLARVADIREETDKPNKPVEVAWSVKDSTGVADVTLESAVRNMRRVEELEKELEACRQEVSEWKAAAYIDLPDDAPEDFKAGCSRPGDLRFLLGKIYDWGEDAVITCGELLAKLEKCSANKETPNDVV